jgi:hypothetical protein
MRRVRALKFRWNKNFFEGVTSLVSIGLKENDPCHVSRADQPTRGNLARRWASVFPG